MPASKDEGTSVLSRKYCFQSGSVGVRFTFDELCLMSYGHSLVTHWFLACEILTID